MLHICLHAVCTHKLVCKATFTGVGYPLAVAPALRLSPCNSQERRDYRPPQVGLHCSRMFNCLQISCTLQNVQEIQRQAFNFTFF